MTMGLKANSDGSGAVQVGGSDAISITSGLAATFPSNVSVTGNVSLTGNASLTGATSTLGYGTGSGGTITQLTSKSTTVTLNKPTGRITMNNAALAGSTAVQFTLNNSLIATSDVIVLNLDFNGDYDVRVVGLDAGSCAIILRNLNLASLSQAVTINFAVIKGATS